MARDEGWLAEHMLILKLTPPNGEPRYVTAAFPGWKVETVGDDIAWMRFGEDGRLYAINPEAGFFGVAPGTGEATNVNAVKTFTGNSIFTNVALTDDGDVWWEGLTEQPPASLTDWKGNPWTPASGKPAARPRSRWSPRPSAGSTARSSARRSPLRRPPPPPVPSVSCAATRSPCCRSAATTWVTTWGTGSRSARPPSPRGDGDKLPRLYFVNWFRQDADGTWLWPGFGENSRVLKWIVERLEGTAAGVESPIGILPTKAALMPAYFDQFGDHLPQAITDEHAALVRRLGG